MILFEGHEQLCASAREHAYQRAQTSTRWKKKNIVFERGFAHSQWPTSTKTSYTNIATFERNHCQSTS